MENKEKISSYRKKEKNVESDYFEEKELNICNCHTYLVCYKNIETCEFLIFIYLFIYFYVGNINCKSVQYKVAFKIVFLKYC